ncbi:DUF397 domain-containing protein [Embleya sp. AB8]|uniref:DUF397 domain-containing protein n=1 Tax=Embleya sp. AB8 TaxID=3156304 RepID=UPI003C73434F
MKTSPDLSAATWRKSSHSNTDGGSCVEVVDGLGMVPVRDSKDPSIGNLSIDPTAWASLVSTLKRA